MSGLRAQGTRLFASVDGLTPWVHDTSLSRLAGNAGKPGFGPGLSPRYCTAYGNTVGT